MCARERARARAMRRIEFAVLCTEETLVMLSPVNRHTLAAAAAAAAAFSLFPFVPPSLMCVSHRVFASRTTHTHTVEANARAEIFCFAP